ncbi:MAG: clostripain-related cysteine peptidase [Planctomycetota bacterium]|jgi:hypothetical protein
MKAADVRPVRTSERLTLNLEALEPRLLLSGNWTLMVYLAADNNLEDAAIDDFLEMASVGSTADVNIAAQVDRISGYDTSYGDWTDTRRGLINSGDVPDTSWGASIGEANMGDASALTTFVNWAIGNYSADNYALVLWDHGGGWRGAGPSAKDSCWDDTNWDYLENNEVRTALEAVPDNIDLLGFDACLMAMIETAYEVHDEASLLVASEELEPWDGWAYDDFLADLVATPTMTAAQLGDAIADTYYQYYGAGIGMTQSVVDLAAVGGVSGLAAAMDDLAATIMSDATGTDYEQLKTHRSAATYFGWDPDYRDLGQFLDDVANDVTITSSISSAASLAHTRYSTAVLSNYADPGGGTGLSVYFQSHGFSPDTDYNASNLLFAADTQWDEFLAWWENGPLGGEPPTLDLSLPAGDTTLWQGETFRIAWFDSDPDNNALISIAYDPDDNSTPWSDSDHVWIAQSLAEDPEGHDDWLYWDTSAVPMGTYTIWGMIDDGGNPAVYDRAVGTVTIEPTPLYGYRADGLSVGVYDLVGGVDFDAGDVVVKFGSNNTVSSIKIGGSQPAEGLAIAISGASYVKSIKDSRSGAPGALAFIAADCPVGSVKLKSGIAGYDVNGQTFGGLTFDADVDGDGSTTDVTALYSASWFGSAKLGGAVTGDVWIGGANLKGIALRSFTTKAGGFSADMNVAGSAGKIRFGGSFASTISIIGSLKSFQIKGGNFEGVVTVGGELGKLDVKGGKRGGGWFCAGANVTVGGLLKNAKVTACETDNASEEFGIFAGSFGKLTIGDWKLGPLDMPFQEGDFCVELL